MSVGETTAIWPLATSPRGTGVVFLWIELVVKASDRENKPSKRLASELQPVATPANRTAAHRRIVDFPTLGDTN
ncbi:hypothetical protein D3C87_1645820 [compost metagenome]